MTLRGFGMSFDCERGTVRNWYVDKFGVRRWADNDAPVEDPCYAITDTGRAMLKDGE